jgi:hypothetical protein
MALDKITTNIIEDDAITAAKIVAGAVEVDIRAGSVTGDKIGYLGDGTGNLSGTIANQQLHFGTAFTLTDDLTVNGDLTLGKVRDDGLGQSITGSGRTLSGTGTLTMGSSVEGEPKAGRVTSVSGMTGILDPAVTGKSVAKAWCSSHWIGGTPFIDDSYNISSFEDRGAGMVRLSFSTSMTNQNYAVAGMSTGSSSVGGLICLAEDEGGAGAGIGGRNTSWVQTRCMEAENGNSIDTRDQTIIVFGD